MGEARLGPHRLFGFWVNIPYEEPCTAWSLSGLKCLRISFLKGGGGRIRLRASSFVRHLILGGAGEGGGEQCHQGGWPRFILDFDNPNSGSGVRGRQRSGFRV